MIRSKLRSEAALILSQCTSGHRIASLSDATTTAVHHPSTESDKHAYPVCSSVERNGASPQLHTGECGYPFGPPMQHEAASIHAPSLKDLIAIGIGTRLGPQKRIAEESHYRTPPLKGLICALP